MSQRAMFECDGCGRVTTVDRAGGPPTGWLSRTFCDQRRIYPAFTARFAPETLQSNGSADYCPECIHKLVPKVETTILAADAESGAVVGVAVG